MSDQLHQCDTASARKELRKFKAFGALAIGLAIGFGYSMASIQHQENSLQASELALKERNSLHNRYMRQLSKKDLEIADLIKLCRQEVSK